MKEWLKKVWEWLKALPGKLYGKFVAFLNGIRRDRLYHLGAGLCIGAVFGISLSMGVWAFVPVLFAGFIKEFVDKWRGQAFDWVDLASTLAGGLFISLCFLL